MAEKKKKAALPVEAGALRGMIKCPQKRGINLNMQESRRSTRLTLLIGCIAIVLLAGSVAKFGVIDQYKRLDRAQAEYNTVHNQYQQAKTLLEDYDRVLMEYRTYSMDWMSGTSGGSSQDLTTIVDRQEVLDLLEQEMLTRGRLVSLQVTGDKMIVSMSGMSLEQISEMFAEIQQSPIVSQVELNLASTENGQAATIMDFSMRITLQQAEEGNK